MSSLKLVKKKNYCPNKKRPGSITKTFEVFEICS